MLQLFLNSKTSVLLQYPRLSLPHSATRHHQSTIVYYMDDLHCLYRMFWIARETAFDAPHANQPTVPIGVVAGYQSLCGDPMLEAFRSSLNDSSRCFVGSGEKIWLLDDRFAVLASPDMSYICFTSRSLCHGLRNVPRVPSIRHLTERFHHCSYRLVAVNFQSLVSFKY